MVKPEWVEPQEKPAMAKNPWSARAKKQAHRSKALAMTRHDVGFIVRPMDSSLP
jgi:hypothetical protein